MVERNNECSKSSATAMTIFNKAKKKNEIVTFPLYSITDFATGNKSRYFCLGNDPWKEIKYSISTFILHYLLGFALL
jgi:hypothetical protein